MIYAQESLIDEIIVDNFAGGGGASTGIELATGRRVAIAINHDPDAIRMHRTNHPYTEHLQASVWDVDPVAVCRGRSVGLAWLSPDCKHFSKAKGAALVDRKIRGLAWITLRWAAKMRPRVIILENVEEFQTWGPVRRGKPVKKLAGTTFRKFISQLEALGYTVEFRELVAADYGAPTSRKRFYLIARCDGKPIVWPKPTHSKTGADGLPKWRSAAEIIGWSLPCPSVFDTKADIMGKYGLKAVRPLAKNTMRRIIRGVDKFTIRSGKPFIVQQKFQNAAQNIEKPLTTVTAVGAHELCKPLLAPVTVTNTSNSVGATVGEPMNTVRTGGGGGQMMVTPFLSECNHSGGGHIAPVGDAYKTITAKHTGGIVAKCTSGPLRKCRVPAHGDGSSEGKPPRVVRGGDHDHGAADGLCGGVKRGPVKPSHKEIAETLREYAEWADANIYEVPIMLPDDLRTAADMLEKGE